LKDDDDVDDDEMVMLSKWGVDGDTRSY